LQTIIVNHILEKFLLFSCVQNLVSWKLTFSNVKRQLILLNVNNFINLLKIKKEAMCPKS